MLSITCLLGTLHVGLQAATMTTTDVFAAPAVGRGGRPEPGREALDPGRYVRRAPSAAAERRASRLSSHLLPCLWPGLGLVRRDRSSRTGSTSLSTTPPSSSLL